MSHKFSRFFLTKLKIKELRKKCVLCCKFSSNQDLDMFGTSKCSSEPYLRMPFSLGFCAESEHFSEMILLRKTSMRLQSSHGLSRELPFTYLYGSTLGPRVVWCKEDFFFFLAAHFLSN